MARFSSAATRPRLRGGSLLRSSNTGRRSRARVWTVILPAPGARNPPRRCQPRTGMSGENPERGVAAQEIQVPRINYQDEYRSMPFRILELVTCPLKLLSDEPRF